MRKIAILVAVCILVLVISSLVLYYTSNHHQLYKKNFSELYANFTETMKSDVSLRLHVIGCDPSYYYFYKNNSVCFGCGRYDACIRYVLVNYGAGYKKMNPLSPFLRGKYTPDDEAKWDTYGLSSVLDCKFESSNVYSCMKGIKLEKRYISVYGGKEKIGLYFIIFPSSSNLNETKTILDAASKIDKNCKVSLSSVICNRLKIRRSGNYEWYILGS